jgi:hypothetical protein
VGVRLAAEFGPYKSTGDFVTLVNDSKESLSCSFLTEATADVKSIAYNLKRHCRCLFVPQSDSEEQELYELGKSEPDLYSVYLECTSDALLRICCWSGILGERDKAQHKCHKVRRIIEVRSDVGMSCVCQLRPVNGVNPVKNDWVRYQISFLECMSLVCDCCLSKVNMHT